MKRSECSNLIRYDDHHHGDRVRTITRHTLIWPALLSRRPINMSVQYGSNAHVTKLKHVSTEGKIK